MPCRDDSAGVVYRPHCCCGFKVTLKCSGARDCLPALETLPNKLSVLASVKYPLLCMVYGVSHVSFGSAFVHVVRISLLAGVVG